AGIPAGDYNLTVSANGIISDPVVFTVGGGGGAALPPHSHGAEKILTSQVHWPIGQYPPTTSPPTPDSPRPQPLAAGVSLNSGGTYQDAGSRVVATGTCGDGLSRCLLNAPSGIKRLRGTFPMDVGEEGADAPLKRTAAVWSRFE